MNRNIGRLEQPKPSRVIEFADGRLGAEYVGTDPRILRFAGRMAITDASIGGDGVAIMRVRDEAQEPGKRNRIAVGNGVMFDEDTGSTLVASGETTAIPDILLGKPYAGGAVNTGSVEAILVEVGRDRFAPTVTVGDVDSPFDHFRQILDDKRAEYEQKQRTEEILKRLPKLLYLSLISLLLVEWLRQTNMYLRIDVWACILLKQTRRLELCVKYMISGKSTTRII